MILSIVFFICLSLSYIIYHKIPKNIIHSKIYIKDQLKNIAALARNQDNLEDFKASQFGISDTFYPNVIKITKFPQSNIPFDSLFIYMKHITTSSNTENISTIFDQYNDVSITAYNVPITQYMIQYYSNFFKIHTNYKKINIIQLIPNFTSTVQDYII